jgi:hypothetical protein
MGIKPQIIQPIAQSLYQLCNAAHLQSATWVTYVAADTYTVLSMNRKLAVLLLGSTSTHSSVFMFVFQDLFYNAVSNSDCTVSGGSITVHGLIGVMILDMNQ